MVICHLVFLSVEKMSVRMLMAPNLLSESNVASLMNPDDAGIVSWIKGIMKHIGDA